MKRIVDEHPDSSEASLLRAASGRHVPPGSRKRAVATLTIAAAALSTASATSAATATALTTASWMKWMVGGGVIALAVSSAVVFRASKATGVPIATPAASVAAPSDSTASTTPPVPVAPAPSAPFAPSAAEVTTRATTKASAPAIVTAAPTALPEALAPGRSSTLGPPPAALPEPKGPPASRLAEETALLARVTQQLGQGRNAEAMAGLDTYDVQHPRGRLRQEAEALRIRAVMATGRRADAEARFRLFRAAHPTSPHVAPLASSLAP